MNLLVFLDSNARAGERGYTRGKRYRITANGKELQRCTYVVAVLGFGLAMFHATKEGQVQVINGWIVEGTTFGRIKVELL